MANDVVTAEQINELLAQGLSKKEAGEQLGISAQKVGLILKSDNDREVLTGEVEVPPSHFADTYEQVENGNIAVLTPTEYQEYSKANGKFEGRPLNKKIKPTIEELRALINAGHKPSYMMNKWGLDAEEFKALVWKLSKKELREVPLRFDLKQDYIQVG